MILGDNSTAQSSSGYDKTYSFDKERFKHDHTLDAINRVCRIYFDEKPVKYQYKTVAACIENNAE